MNISKSSHNTDDSRKSTFNYDGTKRFGDFDDGWKRYHWCKGEFLGYEDDTNTYYIVPDREGSTKVIIDSSQGVINRLEYDHLGKIRSQTTTPQVELLWRRLFAGIESGYIGLGFIWFNQTGNKQRVKFGGIISTMFPIDGYLSIKIPVSNIPKILSDIFEKQEHSIALIGSITFSRNGVPLLDDEIDWEELIPGYVPAAVDNQVAICCISLWAENLITGEREYVGCLDWCMSDAIY